MNPNRNPNSNPNSGAKADHLRRLPRRNAAQNNWHPTAVMSSEQTTACYQRCRQWMPFLGPDMLLQPSIVQDAILLASQSMGITPSRPAEVTEQYRKVRQRLVTDRSLSVEMVVTVVCCFQWLAFPKEWPIDNLFFWTRYSMDLVRLREVEDPARWGVRGKKLWASLMVMSIAQLWQDCLAKRRKGALFSCDHFQGRQARGDRRPMHPSLRA